jgi:hypothetical protein
MRPSDVMDALRRGIESRVDARAVDAPAYGWRYSPWPAEVGQEDYAASLGSHRTYSLIWQSSTFAGLDQGGDLRSGLSSHEVYAESSVMIACRIGLPLDGDQHDAYRDALDGIGELMGAALSLPAASDPQPMQVGVASMRPAVVESRYVEAAVELRIHHLYTLVGG